MENKKIETKTKSNIWKNVGKIATFAAVVLVSVMTKGKVKN